MSKKTKRYRGMHMESNMIQKRYFQIILGNNIIILASLPLILIQMGIEEQWTNNSPIV